MGKLNKTGLNLTDFHYHNDKRMHLSPVRRRSASPKRARVEKTRGRGAAAALPCNGSPSTDAIRRLARRLTRPMLLKPHKSLCGQGSIRLTILKLTSKRMILMMKNFLIKLTPRISMTPRPPRQLLQHNLVNHEHHNKLMGEHVVTTQIRSVKRTSRLQNSANA